MLQLMIACWRERGDVVSAASALLVTAPCDKCMGLLLHDLLCDGGMQVNAEGLCQQRSLKYFQGLAKGCWLVGWAWLEACAAAGSWVPEEPYEVAGDHVALGAPKAGEHGITAL